MLLADKFIHGARTHAFSQRGFILHAVFQRLTEKIHKNYCTTGS
jgi:hypothetical protein